MCLYRLLLKWKDDIAEETLRRPTASACQVVQNVATTLCRVWARWVKTIHMLHDVGRRTDARAACNWSLCTATSDGVEGVYQDASHWLGDSPRAFKASVTVFQMIPLKRSTCELPVGLQGVEWLVAIDLLHKFPLCHATWKMLPYRCVCTPTNQKLRRFDLSSWLPWRWSNQNMGRQKDTANIHQLP